MKMTGPGKGDDFLRETISDSNLERVKGLGGYGAPLDVRKSARAGVPVPQHHHNADCHHGGAHSAHQLHAGVEATRNRYSEFFGLGCDCFAF